VSVGNDMLLDESCQSIEREARHNHPAHKLEHRSLFFSQADRMPAGQEATTVSPQILKGVDGSANFFALIARVLGRAMEFAERERRRH
jgi:hypothetical protein